MNSTASQAALVTNAVDFAGPPAKDTVDNIKLSTSCVELTDQLRRTKLLRSVVRVQR